LNCSFQPILLIDVLVESQSGSWAFSFTKPFMLYLNPMFINVQMFQRELH